jgi:hypothetical protein
MGKHLREVAFLARYQRHPCDFAVELLPQSSLTAATKLRRSIIRTPGTAARTWTLLLGW